MKPLNWAIFFLCLLNLIACHKDADIIHLEYQSTKCSDPWLDTCPPDSFHIDLLELIVDCLENEYDIAVIELTSRFDREMAQACEACSCRSGAILEIKAERRYLKELEKIGFVRL